MVEMVETAAILNQATERSLVILDEIGRGTATFDGLSIAWAALEHLHEVNRCRALFATPLSTSWRALAGTAAGARAATRCGSRSGKTTSCSCTRSRPAPPTAPTASTSPASPACPPPWSTRAEEVLAVLEQGEQSSAVTRLADDLPLFAAAPARPSSGSVGKPVEFEVEKALSTVNPDELTPKQALELLYELRDRTKSRT